jgi:hypothetical protein
LGKGTGRESSRMVPRLGLFLVAPGTRLGLRASARDVAGRMRDEYEALIAEIKGERVARAVG